MPENQESLIGRPTVYTLDLADIICERLAAGESMRSISRDESMPAMSTLFKWLREKQAFSEQYAKAKEESADALFEDMVYIADNEAGQPLIVDGNPVMVEGKPVMSVDGPSVAHARLRVDTRKFAASKLKPKKYGDRTTLNHEGGINYTAMSSEELDDHIKSLEQKLKQSESI